MLRFLTIVMICILAGAEIDLFTPSFPELQKVFGLTPFMVQLTLSVNFVSYCLCSLFSGALGDRYSKRTVILTSLMIFIVGSACAVFAESFLVLLLGRFLQGIGISGPSVLAYVLIADEYPSQKQPAMMGALNGIVTLAMASAPILGSYVNLYFDWRGNFAILLGLGIVCLILSYLTIPHREGDSSVSLSPAAYLPLFRSERVTTFVLGICFLVVPYWLFIGASPILYIEDMGVALEHFGFYQGALSIGFSVTSVVSSRFLKIFGQDRCLYFGIGLCCFSTFLMALLAALGIHHPLLITGAMLVLSVGVVFPINILYPMCLQILDNTKSRAAALVTSVRLILTAVALEAVGFFYNGKFLPIGIAMFCAMVLSLWFIRKIFKNSWLNWGLDNRVAQA